LVEVCGQQADTPFMAQLIERRWNRYGMDRVYVQTTDGIEVGYVDLLVRTVVAKVPEYESELRDCLARWTNAESSAAELGRDRTEESAPSEERNAGDTDLVENSAGSAARAKRDEVNAQAPVANMIARVFGMNTDERSWRVGAKGEEKVGRELAKLGTDWHVLHAVEVGSNGSDIDHVVIGPSGVFTLNTKRHPGGKVWINDNAVWVNGHGTDYLRNSRFEASRAGRLLSKACGSIVRVTPALVFVDLDSFTIKHMPDDVHVTTRYQLVSWLRSLPTTLDASAVDAIFATARLGSTWK